MAEHDVVKPEKIAAAAAVALEQQLVVPATFRREGIDQYKGAKDDTINVVVEGVLPYRTYGWRNNRSTELQFDEYAERKIAVTFGGDVYNAVKLTDEQNDFDLNGWAKLAAKQTEALGRGLEFQAVDTLLGAPYEVELGFAAGETNMRKVLVRARQVMNQLRAPGARTLLVGSDWESKILLDDKISTTLGSTDARTESALSSATIGKLYGFNIVVAPELPTDVAVAMVDSAFIFATGAPSVPQSVPFGATASHNGVALRWIRDYDSLHLQDRSIFNTYKGFRHVVDDLVGKDSDTGQAYVSETEHFVRAIKLTLGGDDVLPPVSGGTDKEQELKALTGLVMSPVVPDESSSSSSE